MMAFISKEELRVSAYSGHLQVAKRVYIICLNRVVILRSHHPFACYC